MFKTLNLRVSLLALSLIFGVCTGSAQEFTISTDSLNFGSVMKGDSDTLVVRVKNLKAHEIFIKVDSIPFEGFYASNMGTFVSLAGKDSMDVLFFFQPGHNVRYNGEALIVGSYAFESYAIDLRGEGHYPGTYYSSTFDLYEEDLKQELKSILNAGAVSFGYNIARDWIYMDIDNKMKNGQGASQNELETAYIGKLVSGYTSRQDAQTNWNVNTEHTWPQSKFNSVEPMQSDMFHLFVVDAGANSRRSNYPFAVVQSPSWTDGGSKYGNQFFEPRDEQKGKSARALLYFATRYQDYGGFLGSTVYDGSKQVAQEELMRQWTKAFPATLADSLRNERIFSLQKNRNPYVDHPEFLDRITRIRSNSVAPTKRELYSNGNRNVWSTDSVWHMYAPHTAHFSVGDTVVWDVHLISTSNITLNVNLQVEHTEFPVIDYPGNLSIAPGESVHFQVKIHQTKLMQGSTIIKLNVFGMGYHALHFTHFPTAVGIGEPDMKEVAIYPNPTGGRLMVQQDMPGELDIEVRDVRGVMVKSTVVNSTLNELNLTGQKPGVYFVQVIRGSKIRTFRIVLK